ncbi:MAG: response regulator, partial [Deltaproteobacteria bacterium]|nr:response regulator [Deltaproteobacteria bacterium]
DAARDAGEAPRGRGETIMLVEDDEPVRRSIARTLLSAGYKVIEAPTGDDAVKSCESLKNAVDLLLTDIVMPGISGVTLATAAREQCPGLKVLFCSGYTDEMLGLDFLGVEKPELIRKPVDKGDLLWKVRETLDK